MSEWRRTDDKLRVDIYLWRWQLYTEADWCTLTASLPLKAQLWEVLVCLCITDCTCPSAWKTCRESVWLFLYFNTEIYSYEIRQPPVEVIVTLLNYYKRLLRWFLGFLCDCVTVLLVGPQILQDAYKTIFNSMSAFYTKVENKPMKGEKIKIRNRLTLFRQMCSVKSYEKVFICSVYKLWRV